MSNIPGVGKGKYGNMTVGVAAVQVPFNQAPRETFIISNLGTVNVYLGFDSAVTTTTGFPILPAGGTFAIDGNVSVWLISGTAGQDVRWIEAG